MHRVLLRVHVLVGGLVSDVKVVIYNEEGMQTLVAVHETDVPWQFKPVEIDDHLWQVYTNAKRDLREATDMIVKAYGFSPRNERWQEEFDAHFGAYVPPPEFDPSDDELERLLEELDAG